MRTVCARCGRSFETFGHAHLCLKCAGDVWAGVVTPAKNPEWIRRCLEEGESLFVHPSIWPRVEKFLKEIEIPYRADFLKWCVEVRAEN